MTLGEYLKDYRKRHHISMQEFSEMSGISKGYISMLERGQHPQSSRALVPSIELGRERAEHLIFKRTHERPEQIAYHKTPYKRTEDLDERAYRTADGADIVERHIKQYRRGNNAERCYTPIKILFIPSERSSHIRLSSNASFFCITYCTLRRLLPSICDL